MIQTARDMKTFLLLFLICAVVSARQCKEPQKEIPSPTKAELQAFANFLSSQGKEKFTVNEQPYHRYWTLLSDGTPGDGVFVGDINNDGESEYLLVGQGGSGHYHSYEAIFKRKANTFIETDFFPGYEKPASNAVHFDPDAIGEPFLTKACGKTYLNFTGYADDPKKYPKRFLWESGKFGRVCDGDGIEDAKGIFNKLMKEKDYPLAKSYLSTFRQECGDRLKGEELYWILSDLSVTAHHSASLVACKSYIKEAEEKGAFQNGSPKVQKALTFNRGLCDQPMTSVASPSKTVMQWCQDPKLSASARDTLTSLFGSPLNCEKAKDFNDIKVKLEGCVTDLAPLASITGLEELKILAGFCNGKDSIVDIASLTLVKSLKSLVLSGLEIKDFSIVSKLAGLENFDYNPQFRNDIGPVDLSILENLKGLSRLRIGINLRVDPSTLPALPSLKLLEIMPKKLSTPDGFRIIGSMKGLEVLMIRLPSEDVAKLPSLPTIKLLFLGVPYQGGATNLAPIAKMTNLEHLTLFKNSIPNFDLSPLSGLTKLKYVKVDGYATDLSPLAKLPNLRSLIFSSGPKDSDIAEMKKQFSVFKGKNLCEVSTNYSRNDEELYRFLEIKQPCKGEFYKKKFEYAPAIY